MPCTEQYDPILVYFKVSDNWLVSTVYSCNICRKTVIDAENAI